MKDEGKKGWDHLGPFESLSKVYLDLRCRLPFGRTVGVGRWPVYVCFREFIGVSGRGE